MAQTVKNHLQYGDPVQWIKEGYLDKRMATHMYGLVMYVTALSPLRYEPCRIRQVGHAYSVAVAGFSCAVVSLVHGARNAGALSAVVGMGLVMRHGRDLPRPDGT